LNPNRFYVLVLKHALLDTAAGGWKRRHAVWYVVTGNNFKTTKWKYENLQTTSTFGDV